MTFHFRGWSLFEAAGGQGGAAPCPRRAHNPIRVIVGYNLNTEFPLGKDTKYGLNRKIYFHCVQQIEKKGEIYFQQQ
jgi:hypothetical protein